MLKKIYRKYNKNYLNEYLLRRDLLHFKTCRSVLDVGCGEGDFVSLMPKKIIGVDSNRETVRKCRKLGLQVKYANATTLPFKDEVFDGLHCSHLIEHMFPEDAYRMLTEAGRVLKPKGIFVLSTPIFWDGFYDDFTHIKPYYPQAIRRYLVHNGAQKTLEKYPYQFKELALEWRFRQLPIPGRLGALAGNFLYKYNIHTLKKDAYTLVLQKQ